MIVQVRVDDRLIHGQVALVWTKELNTTRISSPTSTPWRATPFA